MKNYMCLHRCVNDLLGCVSINEMYYRPKFKRKWECREKRSPLRRSKLGIQGGSLGELRVGFVTLALSY
jgi:hypothetical protein